jgi:hypothetical protein
MVRKAKMIKYCNDCENFYDDEYRSTICPHKGMGYCEKCDCVVCVCVEVKGTSAEAHKEKGNVWSGNVRQDTRGYRRA